MTVASFERDLYYELLEVTKFSRKKLPKKNFCEWRSVPIEPREGEAVTFLPRSKMYVAYKVPI
jgi:hypothetical protein